MASWQFDFHFIPLDVITSHYGATPVVIANEDFERHDWWSGYQSGREIETEITSILPQLESWSSQVERWGSDDGNRVDLVWEATDITGIFVRVDVRQISQQFLTEIVNIARKHHFVIRLNDGRVIRPSVAKLLSATRSSDAFRFCEDPKSFIDSLNTALEDENESE